MRLSCGKAVGWLSVFGAFDSLAHCTMTSESDVVMIKMMAVDLIRPMAIGIMVDMNLRTNGSVVQMFF